MVILAAPMAPGQAEGEAAVVAGAVTGIEKLVSANLKTFMLEPRGRLVTRMEFHRHRTSLETHGIRVVFPHMK